MSKARKAAATAEKGVEPPEAPVVPEAAEAETTMPHAFGRSDNRSNAWLAGLERIGERLARRIRTLVEPLTQSRTAVTAAQIEVRRFEDWQATLPDFLSLSLYRLRPLKGTILVILEPDFVARAVDVFYGGSGEVRSSRTREFTQSEERLIARFADGVIERLGEAWTEVGTLAPTLASRETNIGYANVFRPGENVAVQRLVMTPGHGKPASITIVYPVAALRMIDSQLTARVHDDAGPADEVWRARMAYALQQVRLPVRSVLARPELTLAQVLEMKPGDIIPVVLPPRVPLIVARKRLAMGTIGEKDGHAALMIDHIEKGAFQ